MAVPKVFFAGPRAGIATQRDLALKYLEGLHNDQTIQLIAFDRSIPAPVRTGIEEFKRQIRDCDVVIFAIATSVGSIKLGDNGDPTTPTLNEWELATHLPIPTYLLLNQHLSDSFLSTIPEPLERAVWEKLKTSIPDKHIMLFREGCEKDLMMVIARVIASFLSASRSLSLDVIAPWTREAHKSLLSYLTTPNAASEYEGRIEFLLPLAQNELQAGAVQLIAASYTLRRLARDADIVAGYSIPWLNQAWLLLHHTDRSPTNLRLLASEPSSMEHLIANKLKADNPEWFAVLANGLRSLVIEWINEYGLCLRYGWQFKREIMAYEAAIELGSSIAWVLGPTLANVNARLYEVYLAALCYGQEITKLQRILHEKTISNLIPHGEDKKARIYQLEGLTAATLENFNKAINDYMNAIAEFEKLDKRRLANVAHSYIMIAALKANMKPADDREKIQRECLGLIKRHTKKDLNDIANSFYRKVWDRTWNVNDFKSIWNPKIS